MFCYLEILLSAQPSQISWAGVLHRDQFILDVCPPVLAPTRENIPMFDYPFETGNSALLNIVYVSLALFRTLWETPPLPLCLPLLYLSASLAYLITCWLSVAGLIAALQWLAVWRSGRGLHNVSRPYQSSITAPHSLSPSPPLSTFHTYASAHTAAERRTWRIFLLRLGQKP